MKNIKILIGVILVTQTLMYNCSSDDNSTEEQEIIRATAEAFSNLKIASLEAKVQNFQFNTDQTSVFVSERGVQFILIGSCFTQNGLPISGLADLQVVELFERGTMLSTSKPTMGIMPNGDKALLISGGEFFINATQNGSQLDLDCPIQVYIPTDLTGGTDTEMTLWHGNGLDNDCDGIDDDCDGFAWEEVETNGQAEEVEAFQGDAGENYVTEFGEFGWTNVDRFHSDPRPKTTLLVDVPTGFNQTNSNVYISFNGEPNALGNLDTFIESSEQFSEHYGQIPIGLDCHIVFVSENNGDFLYAIKAVTITDGQIISILDVDLSTATASDLETLINNLP